MATVHLLRVGALAPDLLVEIGSAISANLGCEASLSKTALDPAFAFDPDRGQHNATEILNRLAGMPCSAADRVLGVTGVDLFIPIFTYVFGEAFLGRPAALISLHRLSLSFYGLPDDPARTLQRAQTEAIHELGHTFGLIHCPDYACAMHASRVADEIDLKGPGFCADCAASLAGKGLRPQTCR